MLDLEARQSAYGKRKRELSRKIFQLKKKAKTGIELNEDEAYDLDEAKDELAEVIAKIAKFENLMDNC